MYSQRSLKEMFFTFEQEQKMSFPKSLRDSFNKRVIDLQNEERRKL